jgi:hypothetical protein
VSYFNFVILKLICIFAFMLFHAPKAQICFLRYLLRSYPCRTLLLGSPDVIEVKESLKTNLNICVQKKALNHSKLLVHSQI